MLNLNVHVAEHTDPLPRQALNIVDFVSLFILSLFIGISALLGIYLYSGLSSPILSLS
jgi:hypothetical protein